MITRARLQKAAILSSRFLVVGALSTLIEIGVFNLLFLALEWDPVWAKVIASLVALINAYFGNREWAFKNRGIHGRRLELVLFVAVNGACTVLGAVIVWVGTLSFPGAGAVLVNVINLASIAIVVLVRFVLYHFVVFPGSRGGKAIDSSTQ